MRAKCATGVMLAAGAVGAMAGESVHFEMPDTGLAPSYGVFEFASHMGERHGGSSLSWSSYKVAVPFLDPRKSHAGKWRFDASLEAEATLVDTCGTLDLRRNELYTFTMPLVMIHTDGNAGYWAMGVVPTMSSDFAGTSRVWDVVPFVRRKVQMSKTFSYSIGAAVSPRFAKRAVLPLIGFSWTPTDEWEVRLERLQLSALYSASDRLKVGPFIAARGGAWMVDTPVGDRLFRVSSAVVGLTAEYDFHKGNDPKRIIFASVGATTATRAEFCERTANKHRIESHHYKPGLYVTAGVDFRF